MLQLSPKDVIQLNLTGLLLRDLSELFFELRHHYEEGGKNQEEILSPAALSTVGLRRATAVRSLRLTNLCGCSISVSSSLRGGASGLPSLEIASGSSSDLNEVVGSGRAFDARFSLKFLADEQNDFEDRQPVVGLKVDSSVPSSRLCDILPLHCQKDERSNLQARPQRRHDGRNSPETAFSEGLRVHTSYRAEPVVEWCMQNQRLRSSVPEVYNLRKGKDLLSSKCWSPEDVVSDDTANQLFRHPTSDDSEAPDHHMSTRHSSSVNWLRPYFKNDVPEWTDMTCTLEMARDRLMLPDSNWIWTDDWTVDVGGEIGEAIDSDGWEYEEDFENFSSKPRYYRRGDTCRRRRWTRTRILRPPSLDDHNRVLKCVWETTTDVNGNKSVTVRSPVRIRNCTAIPLAFYVFSPSWDEDKFIGVAPPESWLHVPIVFATCVYLRLAKKSQNKQGSSIQDCVTTERVMILASSYNSKRNVRTQMDLQDVSGTVLQFLLELKSEKGVLDITVKPVLCIINQLPCQIECQLGEILRPGDRRPPDTRDSRDRKKARITITESMKIGSGDQTSSVSVNPLLNPHLSLRVPGYQWSSWHRIVNRKSTSETWRPAEAEEDIYFSQKSDADYADETKCVVQFKRNSKIGDALLLILSVECGHCPTIRLYAQYWIMDKTGFGCHFTDGFQDLLGSVPETETSRRSYIQAEEKKAPKMKADMGLPGHQWSIGMSGMTTFFSKRERLSLSIETGAESQGPKKSGLRSKWVTPMDISNVMPKTVFSVDEMNGPRRFELAISVTVCPGVFGRTKLVTLYPRYQIVNLLHRELVIAQDGCLESELLVPSQSAVPFHWEKGHSPPKVRLGAPSVEQRDSRRYASCWTNGRFRLDRIGITSLRIPTDRDLSKTPMVVQAEVRLATKEQSSAVVVVIWSANEKSNPLYLLRNSTPHTILCRQPLQDEEGGNSEPTEHRVLNQEGCSGKNLVSNGFHCGTEIGPMIKYFLGIERIEEFVWVLRPGDVVCFGFDDPEKAHILEWTFVERGSPRFHDKCTKAVLEVNAMGSSSILPLDDGRSVQCRIGAEHSTKLIEFTSSGFADRFSDIDALSLFNQQHGLQQDLASSESPTGTATSPLENEDEENTTFSIRVDVPGLCISVVDNLNASVHGREILLVSFDDGFISFSQTREGYHEFEARLMMLQIDNHVNNSVHPVLVSSRRYHR